MNDVKVRFVNLPLQFHSHREEIQSRVYSVLESADYILGSEVREFEKNFAEYCGCEYAVGVANGTDGLFLTMKALGIGPGDEVITAPNSFIASAGAVVAAGAKPVFVDVQEDYNIDPDLIEPAVTGRTKAIIPVHLTGKPASMQQILDIAGKHSLYVIEDAAQAVGAGYQGKKVGSLGTAACFSLHPLKNLNCCGDGGVITTNIKDLAEKLTKLRNHGLKNRDECDFWGYNSRLDSIQAAILNVRLKYLDQIRERIDRIASMYREGLAETVTVPVAGDNEQPYYHNFVILCENRAGLQAFLLERGIETKIHYPILLHLQKPAAQFGYKKGDLPVAEAQVEKILSLPLYAELTDEQVTLVIQSIKEFYSSA